MSPGFRVVSIAKKCSFAEIAFHDFGGEFCLSLESWEQVFLISIALETGLRNYRFSLVCRIQNSLGVGGGTLNFATLNHDKQ